MNLLAATAAKIAGVPVLLDAGGADAPLPPAILPLVRVLVPLLLPVPPMTLLLRLSSQVDILSPNETELARLTGLPTSTEDEILAAARHLQVQGVSNVLCKLGTQGSLWVSDKEVLRQPAILAPKVVDTTGAGDCFTGTFAVAKMEGRDTAEAMKFAAAAASLCVQGKGAMASLPDRAATLGLLGWSA